ncbi:MAG: cation:proton antiporter [Verrucomicrobia bacterium]|nr:cation:proton antiporter [Verrucomicrobiota bacterium]
MHHEIALISTIAVGLVYALIGGYIASRLRLPPLVGYLLAGIGVGPFTPGFVADAKLAPQLAEIGVILLMFGVGLHFSLRDLLAVRRVAVPGALVQVVATVALSYGVTRLWGWGIGAGLVLGLALSVASTVVLLRALETQGILNSLSGRIAVGWLVVEDLFTVVVLVLMPALAALLVEQPVSAAPANHSEWDLLLTLGIALAKLVAFVLFMLLVGSRLLRWLLDRVAATASRELFTLAVVAAAIGIGFGASEGFGLSFALGAFFAGVVVGECGHGERAAAELRPLQDVFNALFFVAIGMLFDPSILLRQPFVELGVVAVIVLGKPAITFLIVVLLRYPIGAALIIAAGLAQIGEFSFILAELGIGLHLLPADAQSLIVAGALISIALNSFLLRAGRAIAFSAGTAERREQASTV